MIATRRRTTETIAVVGVPSDVIMRAVIAAVPNHGIEERPNERRLTCAPVSDSLEHV